MRLTVCNYGKYDPKRRANGEQAVNKRRASGEQAATDNNVKNEKNEKNGNAPFSFSLNFCAFKSGIALELVW